MEENKGEQQLKQIAEKCKEKETPLTEDENSKDYSAMEMLDLGDQQNYKTKIVQNRWQQHRNEWLKTGQKQNVESEPKNGV